MSSLLIVVESECRVYSCRVLNIIRDRDSEEGQQQTIAELAALGDASRTDSVFTITEKQLRGTSVDALRKVYTSADHLLSRELIFLPHLMQEYGRASVALNCVGGVQTAKMAALLKPRGALVTYGAMARQPVQLSAAALIFEDVHAHGFWMSRWSVL